MYFYFCVLLHSPENGVKQIEPAHDPLPANAVRLPLLQHYVQDKLQAEGGAGRAREAASGQGPSSSRSVPARARPGPSSVAASGQ